MSLKRARTDVTASEKLELFELFKKLPKMSEKKALKVKSGFLQLAIQNEAKIRAEVAEQRGNNRKRHHTRKNEDVQDGLYDWYKFANLRSVKVNGPILRQKSDVDMPPAPADMTKNDFLQCVDIDNDVEIATEETIEEREQEIVTRYSAQSEIVEGEDEEEPKEPDPVPIPQNADMRKMLDQLCIGLETKGFSSMEEFDTFTGQIVIFCEKILFSGTLPSFLHLKLTNVRA